MTDPWAKGAARCAVCGTRRPDADPDCPRCDGAAQNAWLENVRRGGRKRATTEFAHGFGGPMRGLGFLGRNLRPLLPYVALPVAINVILFALIIVGGVWWVHGSIHGILGSEAWWAGTLEWLIQILLWAVMLVVSFFIFTLVGTVVAAPFSELLSEKVEALAMGKPHDDPFSLRQLVRDVLIPMFEAAKLVLLQLVILAMVMVFWFVPVVGQIPLLLVLAFFAGLDFLDPVLERKRYRTGEKVGFLWRHKALCLGFGSACYVLLLVPFIQLLILPVSVIGATLMYLGVPDK